MDKLMKLFWIKGGIHMGHIRNDCDFFAPLGVKK